MQQLTIAPTFAGWQSAARRALSAGIPPQELSWAELQDRAPGLALFDEADSVEPSPTRFRVPRAFLAIAKNVACHRDAVRWGLLYRVLWRLTHGESHLLEIATDPDVHRLGQMDKSVRQDVHKMRAFVRFREVRREDGSWFVAWFEPEHHIVELNSGFFADRFASMRWSILTPDRCMHWDGETLSFSEGVPRSAAPDEDAVESLWLTYYSHIFNPARVKTRAMQREMPKKYWRNLPEAAVIPALLEEAPRRVETMINDSTAKDSGGLDWHPAEVPPSRDLAKIRDAAAGCTACPLYRNATQTVFGEGSRHAEVFFVGEQPGDQEDREGHPFIGPAGKLLDRAMEEAGVDRKDAYVTNAVKHFKWDPRGKRRLHQTPNSRDIAACRPWLEAELSIVKPKILVCLGATAAKTIFGPAIRVTKDRGRWLESTYCPRTLVTVHPSALLRAPDEESRRANYELFLTDLRMVAEALQAR